MTAIMHVLDEQPSPSMMGTPSFHRNPCCCFQGKIIKVKDRAFNDQRYFICDQKLASLGWVERTSWEEGLKVTIDWYLKNGFSSYWEHGDVEVPLLFPVCYACCRFCFAPYVLLRIPDSTSKMFRHTSFLTLKRVRCAGSTGSAPQGAKHSADADTVISAQDPHRQGRLQSGTQEADKQASPFSTLSSELHQDVVSLRAQAVWPTMFCFDVLALPSIPLYIC